MLGSGVYLHFQGKQLQYFHFCLLPSPRRELHVFPFKSTPHPLSKGFQRETIFVTSCLLTWRSKSSQNGVHS